MCPISSKMILMYTASLAMMYNAAKYASVVYEITYFIMLAMLRTAQFFCGMAESLDRKKMTPCPAASTGGSAYPLHFPALIVFCHLPPLLPYNYVFVMVWGAVCVPFLPK